MNKPPERDSNPVMHPVPDERNNEVDLELCNKRRYIFYSDDEKTRLFHLFLANA
jgi:aspartate carbamoyltransferase catalytic subunit